MDLLRQGLHFRGVREFGRQNYGNAYEAFKSAGNYRDSIFQMAEIYRQSSQPISEIATHYWAAYNAGDKAALPWLCTLEEGIAYESKIEHPRFQEIKAELAALQKAREPVVARELSELSFTIGLLEEGLRYLTKAVLLGDPEARITFADLLTLGPTSSRHFELYKLMLDKEVFDFKGFPFEPELTPYSSSSLGIAEEEPEISEEMSSLLFWLYDQGDSELRTPGLLMRRLLQEMSTADSYDLFISYHNQIKDSFGYKGGIWSDITFIFYLVGNLINASKKPDLAVYEYLADKYGVRDLFDEMVLEHINAKKNAQYDGRSYDDDINAFTYAANFYLESTKNQIPIDYQLPSVNSFLLCVENIDFDRAQEIFSKVLTDAKSGLGGACLELANLLELTDRLRFDLDVLPKTFISFTFDSILTAIKEEKCELLRRTLLEFKPNGERPYFMDELEFELLSPVSDNTK